MAKGTRIEGWDASSVLDKTQDELVKRMTAATIVVRDTAKVLVNRGNASGRNPSAAGEAPKKVTGRLQASLTAAVSVEDGVVVGRVGSNVPYARRLELGFVGVDAKGRKVSQAPRPYLRPAVEKSRTTIAKILGIGRKGR